MKYISLVRRANLQLIGQIVQRDRRDLMKPVVLGQVVFRRPFRQVTVGSREVEEILGVV